MPILFGVISTMLVFQAGSFTRRSGSRRFWGGRAGTPRRRYRFDSSVQVGFLGFGFGRGFHFTGSVKLTGHALVCCPVKYSRRLEKSIWDVSRNGLGDGFDYASQFDGLGVKI
jgi:hypothetical protein